MRERYKAIYLSPHLDDAALSCGGQIFQQTSQGEPILIVTIMAGEPASDMPLSEFAQSLHERWELPHDAVTGRREEDGVASQILGADYVHWSLLDCVYRTDSATSEPCYPTWESILTTFHSADEAVVTWLTHQLTKLPPAEQIYAPLTAGNHVDHRLVRRAAEQAFGDGLLYYEDYPYAADPEKVTAVLTPSLQQWQAINVALTETAVRIKTDAIWAFVSQRSSFFTNRADLDDKIKHYTATVGGERQWRLLNQR